MVSQVSSGVQVRAEALLPLPITIASGHGWELCHCTDLSHHLPSAPQRHTSYSFLSVDIQKESVLSFVQRKEQKTYNSGDSPVVTHLTTNPPVHRLSTAERTGSAIVDVLWSYVIWGGKIKINKYMLF
ncbi:PA domain-containing [Pyrenophora seminiperda CCB06]|uniref:PA domain-containing n=1 Tax=Pyrenophora seminiperda CCB06 TaxID=1302712 RepID=A0A3M7M682_9PLEO|nr:PA domain-containing [Pyrenophora seminiperda CCB06]